MKYILLLFCLLIQAVLIAQTKEHESWIRTGNEFYQQKQYARAVETYQKAIDADESDSIAIYNQAAAIFRQDQKVEAAKIYSSLVNKLKGNNLKAKTFYNKGVILSREKNIEESIEAYKNALRNDPSDGEARDNLQKALLELKRKAPPPKKEEEKKNKKQQDQQQKQEQSKMSPSESQQKLQLLQRKEKEVQQRIQKEKSKTGGSQQKDW